MSGLLVETGRALYGERWQSEIARALDVSDRTVRRWIAGNEEPRPGIYVDLLRIVVERQAELDDVAERLKQIGS